MNSAYNYLTVNNPNIPVLKCTETRVIPYGQFINSPADQHNDFDGTVAQVQSQDMYLPNVSIRMVQGSFNQDVIFTNQEGAGADLLGSCVFFKANIQTTLKGKPDSDIIESYSGTQNFKFDPNNEYLHRVPANNPLHFFHISFSSDYFTPFLPEGQTWADQLRLKIEHRHRVLSENATPITLSQERILQNIFDCPLTGKLGELMMETSVVQFMLLQLHALFANQPMTLPEGVTKRDLELIHGLKEHISRTFLEDHSITDLSKEFGVNTNKLMTLFKKSFGKSIFEHISDLRMEHAQNLLREEGHRIVDVARILGYKNSNHFSTAFKRRFGIVPSQFR